MMFLPLVFHAKEVHIVHVGDMHGWIYGQKTKPDLGDLGTLLSYYERVVANVSQNPEASVLLIGSGDDCEGTGLSGLTEPKCSEIYRFLSKVPFDMMTVGNHDLSQPASMEFLRSFQGNFSKNALVTTNTYYVADNSSFGLPYKYQILQNGIRVLMISLMYTGDNNYGNTRVQPQTELLESTWFNDLIKEFGPKTDLFLYNTHQGVVMPETRSTYQKLRKLFSQHLNYEVPMHVMCGHTHMVFRTNCPLRNGAKDENCFMTESGKYLERVEHVVWTLEETQVQIPDGELFTGAKVANVTHFDYDFMVPEQNERGEGLAKRFNINPEQFMTENGKMLSKQIHDKLDELNITQVIGFSKHKYHKTHGMGQNDSLQRLWNFGVMPALVFDDKMQQECTQFPITRAALSKDHLYQGNVTLDDTVIAVPFSFNISYLPHLTKNEAECVAFWSNLGLWNIGENAISKETFQKLYDKRNRNPKPLPKHNLFYTYVNNTWERDCYDIITNEYEAPRLMMGYKFCNMTGPEEKRYPVKSGIQLTDALFTEYVRKYMKNETEIDSIDDKNLSSAYFNVGIATAVAWSLGIVLIAFFVFRK
ncbi:5'_nucleotidase family protein [Hexamita inflata]|uniref:5' nucleotidase family protein n=1 Tax=Hexamita inflata TaxID=28002 RepID=A0AA86N8L3_9EUKA|nr:5' nucleotidase family protein [Hexamita inflata]